MNTAGICPHCGKPNTGILAGHLDAIVAAMKAGETYTSIADRHGVTVQAVSMFVKRYGLRQYRPAPGSTKPQRSTTGVNNYRIKLRRAGITGADFTKAVEAFKAAQP